MWTALNATGGVLIAWQLHVWYRTAKVYGRSAFNEAFHLMVKVSWRTSRRFRLLAGLAGIGSALLATICPGLLPPTPLGLWFAAAICAVTSSVLPPAAILLGCSHGANHGLYAQVAWAVLPFNMAHLLDMYELRPLPRGPLHEGNHRALPSSSWLLVVMRLAGIVPLIVLDTRTSTEPVRAEISFILSREQLSRKTIFVVGQLGECPALEEFRPWIGGALPAVRIVRESEVQQALKKVRTQWLRGASA